MQAMNDNEIKFWSSPVIDVIVGEWMDVRECSRGRVYVYTLFRDYQHKLSCQKSKNSVRELIVIVVFFFMVDFSPIS